MFMDLLWRLNQNEFHWLPVLLLFQKLKAMNTQDGHIEWDDQPHFYLFKIKPIGFFLECDWTHRRWARKNGHLPPPLVGLSNKIKPQGDAFSLKERQILDGLAGGVPIRLCFVVGLMFWLFFFLLAELIWVMTVISLSRRIQPREPPDDPQYKLYVTIFGIPSQHQPIIGSINRNRFLGVFFSNNSL